MTLRLNYVQHAPQFFKKLNEFSQLVHDSSIEHHIATLVQIRASQMNGCAFCVDMHVKQARIQGERDLRVHHVAIWRESTLFTPRERAALAWTEALTKLSDHGVSDEAYGNAREQFSEKEIVDLTFQVMTINAWNRVNVAFLTEPGSADKLFGLDKANLS